MSRNLSLEEKSEIKAFLEMGHKQVDIAKKYLINQSTISRIAKKIRETGLINRKVGSGRKRSLDSYDLNHLERLIKINPQVGSLKIKMTSLKIEKRMYLQAQ